MLRVCVLGELQLELDGQLLALPSRRPARALLAWLALHPGMHARSTVAGRLWPNVLDESAHRELISLLAQAGDRSAALVAYQRLADRLGRELGVAPSPATRALAAGLRSHTGMPQQRSLPPAPSRHAERPPLPARIVA